MNPTLWQTEDGAVWAGGSSGVLCRFERDRWYACAPEAFAKLNVPVAGLPARDGAVWFLGISSYRALRFDPKGLWTTYKDLVGGMETPDGSVWFRERGAGGMPVRYRNGIWLRYTPSDGTMDGGIRGLERTSDGALWLPGRHRGGSAVSRYDGKEWRIYTEKEGRGHPLPIPLVYRED